jgi:hypothetical protein
VIILCLIEDTLLFSMKSTSYGQDLSMRKILSCIEKFCRAAALAKFTLRNQTRR